MSTVEKILRGQRYEIVYADFPWPWYTPQGTAKCPYKLMTEDEVTGFQFGNFMAKRCVVFLWCTGPFWLQQALIIHQWCQRWGLRSAGIPFVWIKTKKDGTPIGAAGPRPTITKPLTEFVAAITNVKRGRPLPLSTEAMPQTVFETQDIYSPKAPPGSHSRKPAAVRSAIDQLYAPGFSRVELFARERVADWDGWGDEYPSERITE